MIELVNFTKKYGNRVLFDKINLKFNENGLYSIIGKSGCGKSTLLNCLSTLDIDYDGDILIDNKLLKSLSEEEIQDIRMNKIGFIFQSFNLFENDTVYNNIKLAQACYDKNLESNLDNEINIILEKLNISDIKNSYVKYLSGGEKQRVAIGRALIKKPSIIFCDEPTGSLDENNSDIIFSILQEISKDNLVIVVTHDIKRAKQYSNFIFNMKDKTMISNKNILVPAKSKPNKHLIGKLSFKTIFRSIKDNMKSRKFRYIVSNIMFSLSLICLGLTIFVSDNISQGINKAFSNLIPANSLILRKKGSTSPPQISACDDKKVKELFLKYNDKLNYYGTKFLIDYKEFFPERGNFYYEKNKTLQPFYPLTVRNINDFIYADEEFLKTEKCFPKFSDKLRDDEIIISLDYANMEKLCLSLRIERNFESLGNYIEENPFNLILKTRNDNWNYLDEQIFRVKSIIIKPKVEIYHTNNLFNEKVFKDFMHFPCSYNIYAKHDLPWIMNQIYYVQTKLFPCEFLNEVQYDNDFSSIIFEPDNEIFSPNICVEDNLCFSNKVFLMNSKNDIFKKSIINEIQQIDSKYKDYYFSTPGGYMNYGSNLFNGFANEVYFANNKESLNELENTFQKIEISKYKDAKFSTKIARGYALDTSSENVRFSIKFDGKYKGSKEFSPNNVAISTALAKKISTENMLGKDIYLMLNYDTKSDEKFYYKKYKKIKLKVIGLVENKSYKLYQNKDFSISLFRDLFQISSIKLIPDSIVFEFDKKPNKKSIDYVNEHIRNYEIIDPFQSIDSSMNEIFDYFDIGLIIFTIFSSVSTLLLMFVVNAINFEDDKKQIAIYKMLGFKNKQINKMQLLKNFSYTIPSIFSSVISLILIFFVLGDFLSKSMGLDVGFSFPFIAIFGIVILAISMTFISYFSVSKYIQKVKLTEELHKIT